MRNDSGKARLEMSGTLTAIDCAERISSVLRRKFAWTRCADKWLASRIGADQRTAQNYLYGKHCPPAHTLIELMAECHEIADEVNQLVAERRAARELLYGKAGEMRLRFSAHLDAEAEHAIKRAAAKTARREEMEKSSRELAEMRRRCK